MFPNYIIKLFNITLRIINEAFSGESEIKIVFRIVFRINNVILIKLVIDYLSFLIFKRFQCKIHLKM